ncbi:RIP metalloprotease RseP [Thermochromatium tepidum]|uniref:Zinc metalloprotease n=1 Tax=Thermochromatium tepidum ATCC 43061 TaxID=316276 RepID=A0A6I6E9B2_THETI|nr:RIP metalloprotease RseP [Thermochromatium tepidum]QGU31529.1 RIP metalloprotease RseP [Thermochromatium tepidum ATCC 43061]
MDIPFSLASFLVALAILITVHEYGHFWAAKRLGVKVLRFSIGFGRPLLAWRLGADRTEYVLAAIPLGGYVKMLDEHEAEAPIPESELDRAFNRQALWKRSAIVVAGPLFNLLFAVLAYWAIFMVGDTELRPIIGTVEPASVAAEAGFRPGDELLAVGERPIQSWENALLALTVAAMDGNDLIVQVRDDTGQVRDRLIPRESVAGLSEEPDLLARLGVTPDRPSLPAVIGEILPGEPAEQAGLQIGDRVIAADGRPIGSWRELVELVRERPEIPIILDVERPDVGLRQIRLIPRALDADGRRVGRIGAGVEARADLMEDYLVRVSHGPIEALGLAFGKTYEMSALMLRVMGRMLIGEASIHNLSGPISIAENAGRTASQGLNAFVKFLAVVSISLGILNLLPIPVLDGGHLMFNLIEWIKGRPLSEEAMIQGQKVGFVLLAVLMTLAFYVDLSRLLG